MASAMGSADPHSAAFIENCGTWITSTATIIKAVEQITMGGRSQRRKCSLEMQYDIIKSLGLDVKSHTGAGPHPNNTGRVFTIVAFLHLETMHG